MSLLPRVFLSLEIKWETQISQKDYKTKFEFFFVTFNYFESEFPLKFAFMLIVCLQQAVIPLFQNFTFSLVKILKKVGVLSKILNKIIKIKWSKKLKNGNCFESFVTVSINST